MSLYRTYVKERLHKMLVALGLDVAYHRAQGDYLYYRNPAGEEVKVLDLLGGYGSLILGHNNREIVETAQNALAKQIPHHAQFSERTQAGALAARLNHILRRETSQADEFNVTFSNSGAEAVEIAAKHAEFERVLKLQDLLEEITFNIDLVRSEVRAGRAAIPEDIFEYSEIRERVFDVRNFNELVVGLVNYNSEQLEKRPIFLLLEKSFHGKLLGSVQFTYNKQFRRPFAYFGLKTRFVPLGRPDIIERIVREERRTLFDLAVEDGTVRIIERELPIFSAFIVEPIQGEGGVNVLDPNFARSIRKTCNELDIPLVVDEIQSGMGRSGRFLASSKIGLKGDYYTLSKSLGGGISKIAATIIRKDRYKPDFGLLHSSTFAEDDFSAAIALKTLEILERNDGEAYRLIEAKGKLLSDALRSVQEEFPDIISCVRGEGLFIGIEFQEQKKSLSSTIKTLAYSKSLGYMLAGYLLRRENIRLAPTGSAPNVLRLEPSMHISSEEIARTADALRRLALLLRYQDALPLIHHLTESERPTPRIELMDFTGAPEYSSADSGVATGSGSRRKVAFINHLITPEGLRQVDPSLRDLEDGELRNFVLKMDPAKKSAPFDPVTIRSRLGNSVDFILYPLCVASEQMVNYLAHGNLDSIRGDVAERIEAARDDGCEVAGLGMYTSIVTNNCTSLRIPEIALTSGNALTIGMGIEAIEQAAAARRLALDDETLVVVGAAGNIASTYSSLLSRHMNKIVLIGSGREGALNRIKKTQASIYEDTWREIQTGSRDGLGILAEKLLELGIVKQWLQDNRKPKDVGTELAAYVREHFGKDPFIEISTDMTDVAKGSIVVCAANTAEPFLEPHHFRNGSVVCDIAVPHNVRPNIRFERPDVLYMHGGIVSTPNGESLHPCARAFLASGQLFACMAETAVLGLSGATQHFSFGAVRREQVQEILSLAKLHGFGLADFRMGSSL